MEYSEMNVQQRAEYLLGKGIEAKLDIDPEALEPGYAAHAIGVGKLPCGYHASEQAAIEAGTAWLREKAKTPNAIAQGREPLAGEAYPGATGSTTPGNHGGRA
jgi:hypothetical protein